MARFSPIAFGLLVPLCWAASLWAVEPNGALDDAAQLVHQALSAEVDGDLLSRQRLLMEAQQASADFAPLHWYQGHVWLGDGQWRTVEQAVENAATVDRLTAYETFRAAQPASTLGNWNAALWCSKHEMGPQWQAHLKNILMIDPDHAAARQALGHQLVGDDWVTPEDQQRLAERAQFAQAGFAKYQVQIDELFKKCTSPALRQREAAQVELRAIKDPLAIPVMQAAAESHGSQVALFVAQWLGSIDHQEAAHALVRIALLAPDMQVRRLATEELKSKSLFDYVPDLLAAMSSPIQFFSTPYYGAQGQFCGFRQVFAQEDVDDLKLQTYQTSVNYVKLPGRGPGKSSSILSMSRDPTQPFGSRNTFIIGDNNREAMAYGALMSEMLSLSAQTEARTRGIQAESENARRRDWNLRCAQLVTAVSAQEFGELPRDMWQWWDKYNETNYQDSKHARYRYNENQYNVPAYGVSIKKGSCFVAGTQVNTLRGLRAIEQLLPGDMVLSRDVNTGELFYKPVIAATTRPPTKTVILSVNNEKIHATTSHLLWVSGRGWTKAGDIQPGELLHAAAEPAVVMSTVDGGVLPTHNLVVADSHTYFVGESRVLSHDVMPRGSAHASVPGELMLAAEH